MPEIPSPLANALADRYALEHHLGEGGMATVYLAEDIKHRRKVAVKVLRPELAHALGPERFLREIEIAASLNHPHILTLIDSGEADGFLYFVMPYVEGDSLRERLHRERPLSETDAVRLTREIVDALAHAHKQGVVHRDVKPDNVMLTEGHAVVTDFGVAKALSAATGRHQMTTAGVTLGTPLYMSPEQASADPAIDHRADLYAVGVMAYEMLAGEPPFMAETTQEVLSAHVITPPTRLDERRSGLSPGIVDVIMRCLEKRPADRWQTAEELRDALDLAAAASGESRAVGGVSGGARSGIGRRWVAAAGVGAIALIALLASPWSPAGRESTTAVSEQVVAVLPFAVRGSDAIAYLGEGMVNLLAPKLDGAGDLRTVDTRALFSVLEREGGGTGPEEARRIAETFGAGLYVIGDVIEAGGRLQLSAALYGVARGDAPLGESTAEGPTDDIFALVDRVAADLLGSVVGPGTRVRQLASVSTTSLPALRAYLECESAYRRSQFVPAVESCQQAIAEDSTYALAYYRLSVAAELATLNDVALTAAEAAYALVDRLDSRQRRLVEGLLAWRQGRYDDAEAAYRALVRNYPDDVEALQQLGEVLFHGNPLHGRSFTEAREPLERMLAYEPENTIPLVHLARIAAYEDRLTQMDSLVERYVQLNPEGDRELEMLALQAFAHSDTSRQSSILERLERASDVTLALSVWDVVVWSDNVRGGEQLARVQASPTRSAEERVVGFATLAALSLAQGKWREAQAHIASLRPLNDALASYYTALWTSLPFVPATPQSLASAREDVVRIDPAAIPPPANPSVFFAVDPSDHPVIREYLIGLTSARLGDAGRASEAASFLERIPAQIGAFSWAEDLALGIRAQIALAAGDTTAAFDLLETIRRELFYLTTVSSAFRGEGLERFTHAELLRLLGRDDHAASFYESVANIAPYEIVYRPWAYLRLAQIAERRGDALDAREYYERFLRAWADADPDLRHWSDSASAGLARLGTD
jgi:serine/threonine-protein kinase